MRYTTRPLSDRTWLRPAAQRINSRFDTKWTTTLHQLGQEVEHLAGRDVVIEVDVREQDIRLDGTLRANARTPEQPGVVVAFETPRHGSMLYRCDRFTTNYAWQGPAWQHNVRAIVLTLEALRAVDRYGATETGQQYTGFKALPAGRAVPASHMTRDEATTVLCGLTDDSLVPLDDASRIKLVRRAKAAAHPDRHAGGRELWDLVEQAARVLGIDP